MEYGIKDYALIFFIAATFALSGFLAGGYVAVNDDFRTMELALK